MTARSVPAALCLGLGSLAAVGCTGTAGGDSAATERVNQVTVDAARSRGETAVVDYVNDGDTLRLHDGRRVRLVQIDAPELHGNCYGRAALETLRRLVWHGASVRLERDPALDAKDAYGRLLRYVFVAGRNVNLALVREGAASPYFFRNQRGRYARALLDAVDEARVARRGYWGSCPRARLDAGLGSVTGPA